MNAEAAPHILLIDDDAAALSNMRHVFEREGYRCTACRSGEAGLAAMQATSFDLVLTDLRMPGIGGMEVLAYIRATTPEVPVIMITGHATLDSAVAAMKAGAYHYIAKPFRLAKAREVVRGALEMRRIKRDASELKLRIEQLSNQTTIITQDRGMQRLLETAGQIAGTDCSVVIHGESGTGKELLARLIHQNSQRAQGPFVAFNCGALHEGLAANELFGHEEGAFTGALGAKIGLFEAAEGGTLFLDEVDELPLSMQIKLLRVLEEHELLRVGSVVPLKVNVRIVAASNRELKGAVEDGRMRNDLYFRLNVMTFTLSPLRERRDDIPLLTYYLLRKYAAMMDRNVQEITPEALQRLVGYDFPGNVRELSNFIERGVALAPGESLGIEHLPQSLGALTVRVFKPQMTAFPATLESQAAEHILQVLKLAEGNRTQAARMLGIDRVSLWRKLKKLGIDPK